MHNEKSISIKEEQTNEMCPEPSTMFLDDPLGVYWSTDHINEDSRPNLGWDENENNNAVVDTLLHTILEAESDCCPPPLLVPKEEELYPDDTFGISCITDFIKEDPELNLEADETENFGPSSVAVKEELQEDVNQEIQLYPTNVKAKEEMEDGVTQEFPQDPLSFEDPFSYIKEDPELQLDVDGATYNVVASASYAANTTRFTGNSEDSCDMSHKETVNQGTVHIKLEIDSEESTHFIMSRDEEKSLFGTKRKCSLRDNKFHKFTCSFCLQRFPSKYRLIMHVFIHIDGVHPPAFLCKSCGEVFTSYMSLNKHLKMGELDTDKRYEGSGDHGNILLESDQEYSVREQTDRQCSSKETWKTTKKSMNEIGNTHTVTNNAEIGDMYDNDEQSCTSGNVNTVALMAKRPHSCVVCGKSVKSHLERHALIHTEEHLHKCDISGKSFTQLGNLNKHSLIHTGIKPHKCNTCGKSFTHLGSLRLHSLIHTGRKPHKCDICGKSFMGLGDLKRHSLIHTGTKPHKCNTCRKSFRQLGNLNKHSLIHTGIKPHKCNTCGKSFTQLGNLMLHSLIHTGIKSHKCDICGKSFTRLGDLKKHSLIHTGKKPYKCGTCGKSFRQLGSVNRHSLIHVGTKPHNCDTMWKKISSDECSQASCINTFKTTQI